MAVENLTKEITALRYDSFPEIFKKMRSLSAQYGNMPTDLLLKSFRTSLGGYNVGFSNPYIQNRRVKAISTLPKDYSKDKVAEMLTAPNSNEVGLRAVEHALEYTAYPLFHTRKTYQELLTYHNYTSPYLVDKKDTQDDYFWREWKLLEKLRTEFDITHFAHEVAGQALQEGKVFYYARYSVDKSHNKINYAFMQQLPSDWIKIVGFNNKSKYTLAFNMMYFAEYGTDINQYGDLFKPFAGDFVSVLTKNNAIDLEKVKKLQSTVGDIDAYYENNKWYYWVILPMTEVFTFEIDDVSRTVVSPFTGLFLDMIQLAQLEQIQLELVQNPLISVLTGEIPYSDNKETRTEDDYKLSNAGREMFEALWYEMLMANNTNGIGLYAAPFKDMTLHSLQESPSAMNIVSQGYQDTMAKAGLSAIVPTQADARAGAVNVSLAIESKFATSIYTCVEKMMNTIIEKLNLKYDFRFHIFGTLATDKDDEETCRKDLTLGYLSSHPRYLALHDMSVFEDIAISSAIVESGVLDYRIPLVTSYSAKSETPMPPNPNGDDNGAGRPPSEDISSDGNEGDADSGKAIFN